MREKSTSRGLDPGWSIVLPWAFFTRLEFRGQEASKAALFHEKGGHKKKKVLSGPNFFRDRMSQKKNGIW